MHRRADVLLEVDRAYFDALRAQAVLRVAEETVAARQLVVDQVTALAASGLKSALDLSFAKVNLSEAQLLLVQAQKRRQAAAYAGLSAALGTSDRRAYDSTDEPLPEPPPADTRPSSRRRCAIGPTWRSSGCCAVRGEVRRRGTRAVVADALAGRRGRDDAVSPGRPEQTEYSAIGVNVTVPLTNGHLFAARHAEAELPAPAPKSSAFTISKTASPVTCRSRGSTRRPPISGSI